MAFYDFMQKLILARQIKFEKGYIRLSDQRVVISPVEPLIAITEALLEEERLIPIVYEKIRKSFSKGFAESVGKLYGLKGLDLTKWLADISNLGGWGKTTLVTFDNKAHNGILRVEDSPFVAYFKGKTNEPVDHIWRGIAAAGATRIFEEDIDFIETKCAISNSKVCEFLYKPRKALTKEEKEKYGWQLPLK